MSKKGPEPFQSSVKPQNDSFVLHPGIPELLEKQFGGFPGLIYRHESDWLAVPRGQAVLNRELRLLRHGAFPFEY